MKITKTVTTDYEVVDVSNATMTYNEEFKSIRSGAKEKHDKCFICEDSFILDDLLHIVFIKDSPNKVVCEHCADDLKEKMLIDSEIKEGKKCGSCKSYLKPTNCGAVCALNGEYTEESRSCKDYKAI